jgi:hypothetical protein
MWYLAVNGSRAVHPPEHTAGYDTIFVQIYMDPPPGVPWMSKNWIFFSQIKLSKLKFFLQKPLFSDSILNLLHFGGTISAPNLKWRV